MAADSHLRVHQRHPEDEGDAVVALDVDGVLQPAAGPAGPARPAAGDPGRRGHRPVGGVRDGIAGVAPRGLGAGRGQGRRPGEVLLGGAVAQPRAQAGALHPGLHPRGRDRVRAVAGVLGPARRAVRDGRSRPAQLGVRRLAQLRPLRGPVPASKGNGPSEKHAFVGIKSNLEVKIVKKNKFWKHFRRLFPIFLMKISGKNG